MEVACRRGNEPQRYQISQLTNIMLLNPHGFRRGLTGTRFLHRGGMNGDDAFYVCVTTIEIRKGVSSVTLHRERRRYALLILSVLYMYVLIWIRRDERSTSGSPLKILGETDDCSLRFRFRSNQRTRRLKKRFGLRKYFLGMRSC